ncbi:hypothetical protein EYF80_045000 [Liparis tanakae]|uniref:Uncharacterized protein n=1 Tax=Liparis tanakae TaxID=230148 RepID=A0A4Z2FVC8_9TELE|nr:hypothetical protein EYF80_045000 [Liparis tanakae]
MMHYQGDCHFVFPLCKVLCGFKAKSRRDWPTSTERALRDLAPVSRSFAIREEVAVDCVATQVGRRGRGSVVGNGWCSSGEVHGPQGVVVDLNSFGQRLGVPAVALTGHMVAGTEGHKTGVVGRRGDGDGAGAAHVGVAQLVGRLLLFNEAVMSVTYSSNGGLLAVSSGGVRDVRSQEDNRLLEHC